MNDISVPLSTQSEDEQEPNLATINFYEIRKYIYFLSSALLILFIEKFAIEWKWAHIFFSYEYGFMKRGLLGQVFRVLSIPTDLDNFKVFSVFMLLGVVVTYYNLIKKFSHKTFFEFAPFFISSPLLLKNLIYDWGRFDQIAIAVIFLQIIWVGEKRKSHYLLLLTPLLIFIHEGTVLWAFPIIFTIAYFENRKTLYLVAPLVLYSVLAILIWGGLDIDADTYLKRLNAWAAPNSVHWAIIYTLTASIKDSIAYSLVGLEINVNSDRGHLAIVLLASSIISLSFLKSMLLVAFNILSLISASALFVVANDHFRWVALMGMINLFFLLYAHKKNQIKDTKILRFYLVAMSIVGLLLPPIGIY